MPDEAHLGSSQAIYIREAVVAQSERLNKTHEHINHHVANYTCSPQSHMFVNPKSIDSVYAVSAVSL